MKSKEKILDRVGAKTTMPKLTANQIKLVVKVKKKEKILVIK
jgi:hypothetical protein